MISELLVVARLALALGRVNRVTFHPDGLTRESDTDHTVMLALIAPALAARLRPDLRPELVAAFAVVHDLVEARVGDTNTIGITAEGRAAKAAREAAALAEIRVELAAFPWLVDMLDRYEAQREPEARWTRYIDKVVPKLTHHLNHGATLRLLRRTADDIRTDGARQRAELLDEYPEFPEADEVLHLATLAAEEACRPRFNRPPLSGCSWTMDGVRWSTDLHVTVRTDLGPWPEVASHRNRVWLRDTEADIVPVMRRLLCAAQPIPADASVKIDASFGSIVAAGNAWRRTFITYGWAVVVYDDELPIALIAGCNGDVGDAAPPVYAFVGPDGLRWGDS